ncbi:MAG: hypothetical protein AB9842_02140 [Bacteroidales bacterium]
MKDINRISELFDAQNHLNDEGVALYAESLLKDDMKGIPGLILEHVMECSDCKIRCLEVYEIIRIQHEMTKGISRNDEVKPPGEPPLDIESDRSAKKIRFYNSRLFNVAAGIIILIGAGLLIVNWIKSIKGDKVMIAEQKVANDTAHHEALMGKSEGIKRWTEKWIGLNPAYEKAFQTNDKLESMLKLVFRSDDFVVQMPDSIAEFRQGMPVKFNWTDKKSKELILKIIDNTGNSIHKRKLKHHLAYEVNKSMEPGLYYWFIEQSNFTVAAGRFGVLKD